MGEAADRAAGTPADRVKIVRDSYERASKDRERLAEAKKLSIEIAPLRGEQLQKTAVDIIKQPAEVTEQIKKLYVIMLGVAGLCVKHRWTTMLFPSFPRRREGGFTFEVQQVTGEDLGRGIEVKTLSWSVIIRANHTEQAVIGECSEVGFSRQASTHATDGVLDAALLPRGMTSQKKVRIDSLWSR